MLFCLNWTKGMLAYISNI